jgi:TolB protein
MIKTDVKITLFLLFLLMISGCTSSNPEVFNPETLSRTSLLMFRSDRGNNRQYYLLNIKSGEIRTIEFILSEVGEINAIDWSPLAKRFFFSFLTQTNADIYSAELNGTNVRNLTNTPEIYESSPVVSPNGNYVAYIETYVNENIMVMRTDGKDVRRIVKPDYKTIEPSWTPDSKYIIFRSNFEGSPNIYIVKQDGSNLRNLSKGSGKDGKFSLSIDGTLLMFDSDRSGKSDIFSLDLKTDQFNNLTNSPARETQPVLSPNMKRVAFKSDLKNGVDIYVLDLETKEIENVTQSPNKVESDYSWSPDSASITFVSDDQNQLEIYNVNLESKQIVNLTNNPANDYAPVWITFQ